ncbi:chitinase CLP-like [Rutidosis leptorrhynchoides]|uniref:chitinase CLP-like n=1 Tax=Rutidosis leptorrhynchoides TaxID=125765 RepID=UPI003A990C9A
MKLFIQLTVLFIAFISHKHEAIAISNLTYTSFVFPVNKHTDAAKTLYSINLMTTFVNMQFSHANFLIDIEGPLTWHDCILLWSTDPETSCPKDKLCKSPISCEEVECTRFRANSFEKSSCPPMTNRSTSPGWGFCTCPVNLKNPINGNCVQPELNGDSFAANASDGRNPFLVYHDINIYAACAPSNSFTSFPTNVSGVMAFSNSPYALPAYYSRSSIKASVALCLPSTSSANGVLFFGSGPFYLLPHSDVDLRSLLSYTPLLKRPDSFSYFIGVNAIVIKHRSIDVVGTTTTKLSTTEPYTTLKTDIYNWVIRRYSVVTKRMLRADPIAPFSLCYRSNIDGTQADVNFPDIEFSLPDGKNWTIYTSNLIKQVTNDVACLAFVDGGATSEHAIVIGTFQMEDNFLHFDIENLSLGFSSSLLNKDTSCANFNFTTGSMDMYP